jgi:RHS repeat-associated protein
MKRSLKCAMRRWLMRLSLILLMAGILPAQAEDCPDWDAAVAYTAGQCATHAGTAYRAKWWNQGAAPDAADPWGAWEAANPPTPEPDACPAWSTSAIYTAGQCVTHAGRRYTARWWTQGETPVVSEWGAWAVQDTPVDPPPPVPTTPAGIYFIDADHLGTPRVISDEAGKIVWRWDFGEPFGDSQPDDDPDGDGVRFDFPLRFPGQYHDRETGLNYNYYRDYDPATGRYTTSDPIGLAGGG